MFEGSERIFRLLDMAELGEALRNVSASTTGCTLPVSLGDLSILIESNIWEELV